MKKIVLLILSLVCLNAFSQQLLPVSSNVVMPFPSPIFLFDYYGIASNNLQVTVQLNDLTSPTQRVKLQIQIEDGSIELKTNPNYLPLIPITLTAGVPVTFQGSDLFDALNINNLMLNGISATYLNSNAGKLPEGQFNFCVTVLDYNTGKALSNPSCASVFLQLEQPPVIVSPTCGDNIMPSNPQIIRFNWQLAGGNMPSAAGFNSFELFLYQITEPNIADPQNAVVNSKAVQVYSSGPVTLNNLTLDFSTVLLVPGEKYVYRIKATGPGGKETFANTGYSQWCWFSYGYANGGVVTLKAPFEGKQFSNTEQKVFDWDVSDKGVNGQPYDYRITIVELNDTSQTLADGLLNNTPFHTSTLATTTLQDGANFLLNTALIPDKKYAWQINVTSNGQEVAESVPQSFYSHSLIDKFYASNQVIKVIQITNPSLTNLAGKCRVQLSDDSTDFKDVNFSNLEMRDIAGRMVLKEGSINFALSGRNDLPLTASIPENGVANFEYVSGIVDKTGLKVDGKIKWTLPHTVKSGEADEVISVTSSFVMNSQGKLSGENGIQLFNTILADPADFGLTLNQTSLLQLSDNVFDVKLFGSVTLPTTILSRNTQPIKIDFKEQQSQLNYISINSLIGSVNSGFAPVNTFGVEFIPIQGAIIDLSDNQSPGKLSADNAWKGVYFEDYKTRLHASGFDGSGQVKIPQQFDFDTTTVNNGNKLWVDGRGLTLKSEFTLTDVVGVKFNTFQSNIKGEFDIRRSVFTSVKISGSTKIPFLDDQNSFTFDILAATDQGLEDGFLNQDLTQLNLVYNPYGGENRMEIAINRAVFVNNDRLSLDIDVTIPELGTTAIVVIDDFRVYGDNFIGIEAKNGSKTLSNSVAGILKGLAVSITDFGAAFTGGQYALTYQVETDLGPGVTGETGAPKMIINSVMATTASAPSSSSAVSPGLPVPDSADASSSKVQTNEFKINIVSPVADAFGRVSLTTNSPEWGTKFEGQIAVTIKQPGVISMGSNIVLGIKQQNPYWYFDAYFEDQTGTGLPISIPTPAGKTIDLFHVSGLEGKIYSGMRATFTGTKMDLAIDPTIICGLGAYVQLLDFHTKGFTWQADGAFEIEFIGSPSQIAAANVTAKLNGKFSFLNANFRTGGGTITKSIAKEVVNQVSAFALDQVFPQTFDVAGNSVTLDAESLKKGSIAIGDFAAGSGFKIGADVTSTPALNVDFATSNFSIGGSADATGAGTFILGVDGVTINATLMNSTEGSFLMDFGDFATSFGGNKTLNKVNFGFDYKSQVVLALDVDAANQKGGFDIDIDGYKFLATADALASSATIGFDINNNTIDLAYNGNNGSASLIGDISGLQLTTSFDNSISKGLFNLVTSSAIVDAEGSPTEGKFKAVEGAKTFEIESNFTTSTGKVKLQFPNNELRGEIATESASVFLKKNALEVGANGKFDGTSGAIHLKEGNTIIDLAADSDSLVGSLAYADGTVSFNSMYNPGDSSYIRYADGGNFKNATVATDYYKVHQKESNEEFMLEQNVADNSGKFLYKVPALSFRGAFDPTNEFASTNISIGADSIEAYFKQDTAAINYVKGQQTFNVYGIDGGNGFVKFDDKALGISTGFGYDQGTSAGNIYYKNGDLVLDLAGNNTETSGSYDFDNTVYQFKGSFKDSLYSFNQIGDEIIEAVAGDSGIGIRYAKNADQIKIFESTNGASVDWNYGGVKLAVSNFSNDYNALYENGALNIRTQVTADLANFNYNDGTYVTSGEVNSSNDALKFNYRNGSDSLRLENTGKEGDYVIAASTSNWSGIMAQSVADDTANFTFTKNADQVKVGRNSNRDFIGFKVGNLTVEGGQKSSNDYIETSVGPVDVVIGNNVGVTIGGATVNLSKNGSGKYVIDVLSGVDVYALKPLASAACSFNFEQNSATLPLVNGALSITLSGGPILNTSQVTSGQDLSVTTSNGTVLSVALSCSQTPIITITENGVNYTLELKTNETKVSAGNYIFTRAHGTGDLELVNGSDKFKLTNTEIEVEVDNYKFMANATEFKAEKGSFKVSADATKAALELGSKKIELKEDESIKIELATDEKISASPNSLQVEYGTKKFTGNASLFKVEETAQSFLAEVKNNEVTLVQGAYAYSAKDTEVKMVNSADRFSVTPSTVSAKYGDKEFDVASDQSISFKNGNQNYSVDATSLDITHDGTSLKVMTDKVQVGIAGNGTIEASDKLLKYTKGSNTILLDNLDATPDFSYVDGSNSLSLGATTGLALNINGNKVIANATKLEIEAGNDKLLLTDSDLDFKYGVYEAEFFDWNNAKLTNGVQEFKVEADKLSATLDANNKITTALVNNEPSLAFTVDGASYDVRTDGTEFDYTGKHFEMNTTEFLRVSDQNATDSTQGLFITSQGLRYVLGDAELKLGTDSNAMEMLYKNYTLAYKNSGDLTFDINNTYLTTIAADKSASFTDGNHLIELNKGTDMTAYSNSSGMTVAFKDFGQSNYGIQAGSGSDYMFVKSEKGENLGIGGDIGGSGLFEFSANKELDLDLSFLNGSTNLDLSIEKGETLKTLNINVNGVEQIAFGGSTTLLADTGSNAVGMDGASHIGEVTETAGGWAKAEIAVQMSLGSAFSLHGNGGIKTGLSIPILCADAPFEFSVTPTQFSFNIAKPSNRAKLMLICAGGLGGLAKADGYANIGLQNTGSAVDLSVGFGLRFSQSFNESVSVEITKAKSVTVAGKTVSTPSCSLTVALSLNTSIDFNANATISIPTSSSGSASLNLGNTSVALVANASASGSACGFTVNLASVAITGNLKMTQVSSGTQFSGASTGTISVGPLSKTLKFDADFII